MLPLSVLDLSFTTTDTAGAQAVRNTVELARVVDALGYRRFWVAEHHNLASVASGGARDHDRRHRRRHPAPARRVRWRDAAQPRAADGGRTVQGAGGPLSRPHRPRHRPRSRHRPDDLAGAAPAAGSPRRRRFPGALQRADALETEGFPDGIRSARSGDAEDGRCRRSGCSARAPTVPSSRAGRAWALPSRTTSPASRLRTRSGSIAAASRPSAWLERPHAILATAAVCAGTDVEAEWLAATVDFNYVRRMSGDYRPLASPEEAKAYSYLGHEEQARRANRARVFVGSPHELQGPAGDLRRRAGADEIMLTTPVFSQDARVQSYRLLAEAFELPAPPHS